MPCNPRDEIGRLRAPDEDAWSALLVILEEPRRNAMPTELGVLLSRAPIDTPDTGAPQTGQVGSSVTLSLR